VVLQQDAPQAFRFGKLRDIDVVHVAAEDVGVRVHVHVDHAGRRAYLRGRRRETGLREGLRGRHGQSNEDVFLHVSLR
jgi:hypothetical protein